MKKFLVVLFVVFFMYGCSGGKEVTVSSDTEVIISKALYLRVDPEIRIACKEATFDGEVVVVTGVKSIRGSKSLWTVPEINVQEDRLVIQIPPEERRYYTVTINKENKEKR